MKNMIRVLFLAFLLSLLAGCSALVEQPTPESAIVPTPASGVKPTPTIELTPLADGKLIDQTIDEASAGSLTLSKIIVRKDNIPLGVDLRGAINTGKLRIELLDPQEKQVWQKDVETGSFSVNEVFTNFTAGDYSLKVSWDGALQVNFDFYWQPNKIENPKVPWTVFIPGVGMLLIAIGFVVYAVIRKLDLRYLAWGGVVWSVTWGLNCIWTVSTYNQISEGLGSLSKSASDPLLSLYLGIFAAIFEVGITYAILRYTKMGQAPWGSALAFGIGFGVLETVLLGLNPVLVAVNAYSSPGSFRIETLQSLMALNNALYAISPIWQRFFTMWIHILAAGTIFYSLVTKQFKWFLAAFAFKAVVDILTTVSQMAGSGSDSGIWLMELVIGICGGAAWWVTFNWLKPRYPEVEVPILPAPVKKEKAKKEEGKE